jgi:hypothetical protein
MNRRLQGTGARNGSFPLPGTAAATAPGPAPDREALPAATGEEKARNGRRKNGARARAGREPSLTRDALFVLCRKEERHVIAESYFYKTEPYYTIVSLENEGRTVRPSSSDVLDAYVIPVCLERARASGVPVCEWGISQAYVPLPAIVYGLNYYATSDKYAVVKDNESAKDVIRHITNNGKYPFCFQRLPEGSDICTCTAVFGETMHAEQGMAVHVKPVYDLFKIPLVKMVFVRNGSSYFLSSLSPVRYSQCTDAEKAFLAEKIAVLEEP